VAFRADLVRFLGGDVTPAQLPALLVDERLERVVELATSSSSSSMRAVKSTST
jgi:hypothetical protein